MALAPPAVGALGSLGGSKRGGCLLRFFFFFFPFGFCVFFGNSMNVDEFCFVWVF